MGFPLVKDGQGNYEGYREADLTRQAKMFEGRNLFLVHGTSDSNVHFQQSEKKRIVVDTWLLEMIV